MVTSRLEFFSFILWFLVLSLDPRRWLGALFALAGVAASIITAVLPSSVIRCLSGPPPSASKFQRPSRSSSTSVNPSVKPFPVPSRKHSRKRPHTAGDAPVSPVTVLKSETCSPTFSDDSIVLQLTSSPGSEIPPPSEPVLPPDQPETQPISLVSVPQDNSSSQSSSATSSSSHAINTTPPIPLHRNSAALKSLDCLDLATPEITSPRGTIVVNSKRPFRLPLPKLVFRKQNNKENVPASGLKESSIPPTRASPMSTSFVATSDVPSRPPTPSRRKFSLFSRERSMSRDKGRDKRVYPPAPSQSPNSDSNSSPRNRNGENSAVLSNAVKGRSVSISLQPSAPMLPELCPLEQTQTPPPRPTRTDPYKMYGVPVPGSERARAFLKAEKEMRVERERLLRLEREKHEDSQAPGNWSGEEATIVNTTVGDVAKTYKKQCEVDELGMSTTPTDQTAPWRLRHSLDSARRGRDSLPMKEQQTRGVLIRRPLKRQTDTDKPGGNRSAKESGYVSDVGVRFVDL